MAEEVITLDHILFNLKAEPYTLSRFYLFCESMQALELLDFWITVQDLRNMYEPGHPRSSYSMNNWSIDEGGEEDVLVEMPKKLSIAAASAAGDGQWTAEDTKRSAATSTSVRSSRALTETLNTPRAKPKKIDMAKFSNAQRLVVACYIAEEAPLEVNISYDMRRDILLRAPKEDSDPPVPGLFDHAQAECEKLMMTNQFNAFKKQADLAAKERKFVARPPPPRPTSVRKNHNEIGHAPLPE